MAETGNDIDIRLGVDGVNQTVAELEKVNAAVSKSAKQTEQMAVAQKKVQEATTKSNVSIGQFGSSLGLAGQALGRVNPAMGQLTSMAGAATGVIQGLTTAGLGPLGIALAAVSFALSAGMGAWDSYKNSQKEAHDALAAMVPTLDDVIARIRKMREEQALATRRAAGTATEDERIGEAGVLEGRLNQADTRMRELFPNGLTAQNRSAIAASASRGHMSAKAREYLALERQAADLRTQLAGELQAAEEARVRTIEQQDAEASSLQSAPESRITATRRASGGTPNAAGGRDKAAQNAAFENAQAQLEAQQSLQDQVFAKQQEFNIAQEEQRVAFEQLMRDKDAERVERAREAEEQITEAMLAENEKRLNAAQAEADARIASAQKTAEMISTIGNITSGVYGFIDDAIKKTDESEEERFKREKARIGVEAAINAVVYGASAAAAFATGNIPGGIGFTAAATMSAAAAVKAGVDAGVGPSASGGGGMQRPDSPQNVGAGNGGGNITVLMTGPVLAGTDRLAFGKELNAVISDANNRYGNAA